MQKLKGKWWAKAIAMVLCISSIITAIISLTAIVYEAQTDNEELLEGIYEQIADNYSAAALTYYQTSTDYDAFLKEVQKRIDPQMRFAIVKSTALEWNGNVQTLAENIGAYGEDAEYIYGTPDDVRKAAYSFTGGEDYYYRFNISSLIGMLSTGYGWETASGDVTSEEVLRVVYVKENKLFYYETESGFYPVHSFCTNENGETHVYTLTPMTDTGFEEVTDAGDTTYEIQSPELKYLDENGNEPPEYAEWQEVQMENADCAFRLLTYEESLVQEQPGSYVQIADDLQPEDLVHGYEDTFISHSLLGHRDAEPKNYYYVFSYVDESIPNDSFPGYFSEAGLWAKRWDNFSQFAIFIEVLSVAVFLFTFFFLLCAAGHRSRDEEIHLGALDTIWFEVISIIVFLLDLMFGALMVYAVGWGGFSVSGMLLVETELAFAFGVVTIWYIMTFAARIKAKKFWRYTCVYWCYKACENVWKKIWSIPVKLWKRITERRRAHIAFYREHTSLFWKTVVLLCGITLVFIISFAVLCVGGFYEELYVLWVMVALILLWLVSLSAVMQMTRLQEGSKRIAEGDFSTPIDTKGLFWEFKTHAENINKVGDGIANAVEKQMKSERFKTELITNVSHDIKTPLTSIINYVDLIKKEEIENEKVQEYIDVLDRQSSRLKKLIEDLMEASKASTGNLAVNFEKCDARVLLTQIVGEFEEKTAANQLEMIVESPDVPVNVKVDSRHIWRVLDNLLGNICKYAQPGTRVYINLVQEGNEAVISFKNISRYRLNISSEELMERFVRGDSSRNTEGSGLGLSIAQSLTNLMHGTMELFVDGDLFKVVLRFPVDGSN